MKRFALAAMMATLMVLGPRAAAASSITITFATGLAPTGGTFLLLAGGHAVGLDIPVGSMVFDNNGATTVYQTSGTGVDTFFGDGHARLSFDTLTNTIQIAGGVPSLGIASNTTLLTGSFYSWVAGPSGLQNGIGADTKSAALLTALGLPTNTQFQFSQFFVSTSFCTSGTTPCTSWNVGNTSISNTVPTVPQVPEPGSVVLLGTGLLGLAASTRRQMRRP